MDLSDFFHFAPNLGSKSGNLSFGGSWEGGVLVRRLKINHIARINCSLGIAKRAKVDETPGP